MAEKAQENKKVAPVKITDVTDGRLRLRGDMPTSNTRNFEARKIKGRDGKGPCKITLETTVIMLPNGDLANIGDTFDPIEEGMSMARFRSLINGKFISAPKGYEDRLMKHWETKGDTPICKEPEGKDGDKTDAGKGDEEK
jgi:hypothetical protein